MDLDWLSFEGTKFKFFQIMLRGRGNGKFCWGLSGGRNLRRSDFKHSNFFGTSLKPN